MIPTRIELSSTITRAVRSYRQPRILVVKRFDRHLRLRHAALAVLVQQATPGLDLVPRRIPAAVRPVVSQRIQHNLADRLAGLASERARKLRGLGVADMNLVLHGKSLGCSGAPYLSTHVSRRKPP